MSSALQRALDVFLAPAADATGDAEVRPSPPSPPTVAVLGSRREALALAAAAALRRSGPGRPRMGCVVVWDQRDRSPGGGGSSPESAIPTGIASPAARKLAERLAGEGLALHLRGRLVWATLPAEPAQAAAAWQRVAARAPAPTVLAAVGPRTPELDRVLAEHDLVLLVEPAAADPVLLELAVASLEELGPSAAVVTPVGLLSRLGALAGLWAPGVRTPTKGDLLRSPVA